MRDTSKRVNRRVGRRMLAEDLREVFVSPARLSALDVRGMVQAPRVRFESEE